MVIVVFWPEVRLTDVAATDLSLPPSVFLLLLQLGSGWTLTVSVSGMSGSMRVSGSPGGMRAPGVWTVAGCLCLLCLLA